jgi:hypothetical protein
VSASLWTHVTIDEIAETGELSRRARLLTIAAALRPRLVPTGATVVGYSRLGFARPSQDAEAVEAFRQGNIKHTEDALIAATAAVEGCPVVTGDRTLTHRAKARRPHGHRAGRAGRPRSADRSPHRRAAGDSTGPRHGMAGSAGRLGKA